MEIQVKHTTRYFYDQPGSYLVQRLRLTPSDNQAQKVLNWKIEMPGIDNALVYEDAFGNVTYLITPPSELKEVTIVASGKVATTDTAGIMGYDQNNIPVQAYLKSTNATQADAAIVRLARRFEKLTGVEQMHALSAEILRLVSYQVGTSNQHTSAAEAVRDGKGVCQDHAHVFIAAARTLGVPARYVSGYMVVDNTETAEAAHAWAEAFIADLGWTGFDVSNQISPDERYVRVAIGMDAKGATPVAGVRRGLSAGREGMDVEVVVAEVDQQ